MISIEKATEVTRNHIDHITHKAAEGCSLCDSVLYEQGRMYEDSRRTDRHYRQAVADYMEKYKREVKFDS
jgi:predicted GTPase